MRTLNKKYIENEDLKAFIIQNNITEEKNVLLQIFTGICEVKFIESLVSTIKELVPNIKIIGSTTSGEILENNTLDCSTILSFSLFENTNIFFEVKSNYV